MAREIDNFYPERFTYHNVRLWDEESAQLLPHWKETHRFIEAARWGCPRPRCAPMPSSWQLWPSGSFLPVPLPDGEPRRLPCPQQGAREAGLTRPASPERRAPGC